MENITPEMVAAWIKKPHANAETGQALSVMLGVTYSMFGTKNILNALKEKQPEMLVAAETIIAAERAVEEEKIRLALATYGTLEAAQKAENLEKALERLGIKKEDVVGRLRSEVYAKITKNANLRPASEVGEGGWAFLQSNVVEIPFAGLPEGRKTLYFEYRPETTGYCIVYSPVYYETVLTHLLKNYKQEEAMADFIAKNCQTPADTEIGYVTNAIYGRRRGANGRFRGLRIKMTHGAARGNVIILSQDSCDFEVQDFEKIPSGTAVIGSPETGKVTGFGFKKDRDIFREVRGIKYNLTKQTAFLDKSSGKKPTRDVVVGKIPLHFDRTAPAIYTLTLRVDADSGFYALLVSKMNSRFRSPRDERVKIEAERLTPSPNQATYTILNSPQKGKVEVWAATNGNGSLYEVEFF